MRISSKVIEGVAGTLLVAATAFAVGAAFDGGSGSPAPAVAPVHHGSEVEVNARAAGDAALARCDRPPEHFRVRAAHLAGGSAVGRDTAWAAGDAAVARYFDEIARQCTAQTGEH
jgi:hypothetical protein